MQRAEKRHRGCIAKQVQVVILGVSDMSFIFSREFKSLIGAAVLTLAPSFAMAISADEIVAKADERRLPKGTLSFNVSVSDFEGKDGEGRKTKYKVLNKSSVASLVETTFPERQQGRKLLMEDDSLWFYTPDIRRAARVSMQQKLTGEIANGDLSRTNLAGDYNAKLIGVKSINGVEAYHLDLRAKSSSVTYSRLEYWVSKADFTPIKTVFYAVSGKVLKTGTFSEVKTILGQKCVTKVTVRDALDPKRYSIMVYANHQRERLPASVFSKESLGE
jgi:outer membrane lipoprotein-sorting protein